jgi:hypothetical protein
MERTDNDPQPDWAALGWITDRLPTCQDADSGGDVWLPRSTCEPTMEAEYTTFVRYWAVTAVGQPWWSPNAAGREDKPVSAEPDRITALEWRVTELEATMRQLLHGSRFRLVVEPR